MGCNFPKKNGGTQTLPRRFFSQISGDALLVLECQEALRELPGQHISRVSWSSWTAGLSFWKGGKNSGSEAKMLIKRWHLCTVRCIYRICLLTVDVNLCSSGGLNVGKIYIVQWVFAKGHQRPPKLWLSRIGFIGWWHGLRFVACTPTTWPLKDYFWTGSDNARPMVHHIDLSCWNQHKMTFALQDHGL